MRTLRESTRRSLAWLALATVAWSPLYGGRAAAATPATHLGELRGTTTIRWTGVKGISLATPDKVVVMPAEAMQLFVEGGTFAYVQFYEDRKIPDECPKRADSLCISWYLAYFSDMSGLIFDTGSSAPGDDHISSISNPPDWRINLGKPLHFYLFTDGKATLVLRPQGFSGTSDYVAGGVVKGAGHRLPVFCHSAACDQETGYASSLRFGGAAFDVGKLGMSRDFVYARVPDEDPLLMDAQSMRYCFYPNDYEPHASPEPEAHPRGCDPPVPEDPRERDAAIYVLEGVRDSLVLGPQTWGLVTVGNTGLTGRQYIGYQVNSVGAPPPAVAAGYGVWFEYGISPPAGRGASGKGGRGTEGGGSGGKITPGVNLPSTGVESPVILWLLLLGLAVRLRGAARRA